MAEQLETEKHLLETLDRISKNSSKYDAIYINISKLQPKNRHPRFINVLAKLFDGLVGASMGSFFTLSNGDFVILGSKIHPEKINKTIEDLKSSMSNDPIIHTTENSSFIKIYNFPDDLASLYVKITSIITMYSNSTETIPVKKNLENYQVDAVVEKFKTIDFKKIIKKQSVIKIISANQFNLMSQEFFIALKDLNSAISENINIASNKWMFIYLTEIIDKIFLSNLTFSNIKKIPNEISLNLSFATIFSDEFQEFIQNKLPLETSLIIEVKLMEVFNNLDLYFKAKDFLHNSNHKILIDQITPSILKTINFENLKPDYIKLFWEPLMEFDTDNQIVKNIVKELSTNNVILAKSNDPKALKWGMSHGITCFQGPYIDEIENALIKSTCPNAKICSNNDCLKRRKIISGKFKDECQYPNILETLLKG
ncbi:MAG: hypothetical protein R3Y43_00285 [Alphaproteobacteria bacterium]